MDNFEIVIGLHSIAMALKNPAREILEICATKEGMADLRKKGDLSEEYLNKKIINQVSGQDFLRAAQQDYAQIGAKYQRIPSQVYLKVSPATIYDFAEIYKILEEKKSIKIICLDQVTDVHNAAAIIRTAAFYGADVLLVAQKGDFNVSPFFARTASGALECVKIVKCNSLPKVLSKLDGLNIRCIGFSEHEKNERSEAIESTAFAGTCLVMGPEDKGLSFAIMRVLKEMVAFKAKGEIHSLNVSVAAAIAMEKYF